MDTALPCPVANPTPARRRWLQFRLRTLLVVVTLLAAVLGWFVIGKSRRHDAVLAIQRLSGKVYFADAPADESWPMRTLREWLPNDWFDDVLGVDLDRCKAHDTDLANLALFPQLRSLSLSTTPITDAGLVQLHGLTQLEIMFLYDSGVTVDGHSKLQMALPHCQIYGPAGDR